MKKIICFIMVFVMLFSLGVTCYADSNTQSALSKEYILNMYTSVEKENSTYSISTESKENFTDRKIEKVEVYKNNRLVKTYSDQEALLYLTNNPAKYDTQDNSIQMENRASGWTGEYRFIYANKVGKTHTQRILSLNDRIELTALALANFSFDALMTYAKPLYSSLVAIFDFATELGGQGKMGSYTVGDTLGKHDDKWFYRTYERKFIGASGTQEWIPNLKVERKEIGYREEYKLWEKSTNKYSYIYADYGERTESYTPLIFNDETAAMKYVNESCNYWDRINVDYMGKTGLINVKFETSHKEYTLLLKKPSDVKVQ